MNILVANRLVNLRRQHGLSQEQLAEQLGISRQAVSKWERAESSPDTDNLIALARLYKVSLDELIEMDLESAQDEQYAEEEAIKEAERIKEEVTVEKDEKIIKMNFAPKIKLNAELETAIQHIKWKVFPYPLIVTIVYVILGSFFDWWHPAWMLFLTVPIYYTALRKNRFDFSRVPIPLYIVPIYLIMGFYFDLWHPGWLIFFTVPLYYWGKAAFPSLRINVPMIVGIVAALAVLGFMVRTDRIVWLVIMGVVLCLTVVNSRPDKKE